MSSLTSISGHFGLPVKVMKRSGLPVAPMMLMAFSYMFFKYGGLPTMFFPSVVVIPTMRFRSREIRFIALMNPFLKEEKPLHACHDDY